MPKTRIKKAFDLQVKNMQLAKPRPKQEVLKEAGYSPSTAKKPYRIIQSNAWQDLLADIDDTKILAQLKKIALDKSDKRASLQAIDMLMKLKDRYPAGKLKSLIFHTELEKYKE